MAAPTIPPRPARAQDAPSTSGNIDVPKIPPRPKRSVERSVSPNRDTYARSPLNDPAFLHNGMPRVSSREESLGANLPRPSSVTLPSIGQEGSEYESLQDFAEESSPKQTKNIAGDLPLYAPTASLATSTAKSRIATVTRTDSSQAAAAVGKLFADSDEKGTPRSASSAGTSTRPQSIYNKDDEEHGIPEIGIRVPMYPNAGDVQAPTPQPSAAAPATGVGFFNNGGQPASRHHSRTKSGREIFHGPPGSYGLHGHGIINSNDFERTWYEKHPEDFAKEKQGEYGRAVPETRKDYHWVGDDLAKLVHQSASRGIGMGTSREAIGTPDEQIGYRASEEYASRMASPRPSSRPQSIHAPKARTSSSKAESPLNTTDGKTPKAGSEHAMESDTEDNVIHIDPPHHRHNKIGGGGYDPPKEDLGPDGGNTEKEGGWISERGYGVPILASDEVAKNPDAEYMQPAVSPELERRGSGEYTINDTDGIPSYISGRKSTSRSSSRNNSVHSGMAGLSRFNSPSENEHTSTPLDNVKEYEPLFPEDEEHVPKDRAKTAVDKLKRPDLARHHFPSQDVWEDTPSSLQLQTTVDEPQAPEESQTHGDFTASSGVFEKPEAEADRKQNLTAEDQTSFLPEKTKRFAKSGFNKDVLSDVNSRPGLNQRFPSHDIWEDTPDHHNLVTTVSGPQTEDTNEYLEDSPATVEKPQIPARPVISAPLAQAKDVSPVDKKAPIIPERPKPQVPARPAKPLSKSSAEKVLTVGDSEGAAPAPKAKPAVPARPAGGKIAALKAGFMSDLNSRLQLGPQVPKVAEPAKEEEVEEKERAPLADARKGRAKGPQRRKPAASPSGAAADAGTAAKPAQTFSFVEATTVWETTEDGNVTVPAAVVAKALEEKIGGVESPKAVKPEEPAATSPEASTVKSSEEPIAAETKDAEVPATEETVSEEPASTSTSTAVQTGQQDVSINNVDGTTETMTTFLGGKAPDEGTVIVKDGVEHLGDSTTARTKGIESASDGGLRASEAAREEAVEKA
ncbi:uncharacterized protein BDZ99DRAFT_410128 [Mytilinidion resinicola]|uniref:Altered inheritance of mitochondria protein 21 n=1 Tax=Mytilinidion resinicola TaxID=574789 RepID=A0A6A6YZG1_9PEZI|nr:uncharacterized protein BDZ99DRAFT_410128 [Mytilinidion resinicola]KAF2813928.1 hypothetical protein BDZ99DRAFT_410128 [Mytilinidion resinicola]